MNQSRNNKIFSFHKKLDLWSTKLTPDYSQQNYDNYSLLSWNGSSKQAVVYFVDDTILYAKLKELIDGAVKVWNWEDGPDAYSDLLNFIYEI